MTLIELVIVMVITGILAGFVGKVIYYQINTYDIVSRRKQGSQNVRFAGALMAREIRAISSPDNIFQAMSDSMRFKVLSGEEISYQLISNNLYRNGELLAENLSNFSFAYFDNEGAPFELPIDDFTRIQRIDFGLETKVGSQTSQSKFRVLPRNFRSL